MRRYYFGRHVELQRGPVLGIAIDFDYDGRPALALGFGFFSVIVYWRAQFVYWRAQ